MRIRHVSDSAPGIERRPTAKGFRYLMPGGAAVRDPATLERIKALVIPPAWTEVWICARCAACRRRSPRRAGGARSRAR